MFNRLRGTFSITTAQTGPHEGNNIQTLSVNGHKCSCGKLQVLHFPYSHLLAACAEIRLKAVQYVKSCLSTTEHYATYATNFNLIRHETYWPASSFPNLRANPTYARHKGQPKSLRLRNEMDAREGRKKSTYNICHQEGHNCTRIDPRPADRNVLTMGDDHRSS
ncbi:uncharacterized protein LOC131153835 [Malania oleifera]|uniref:uncharacterized protein LOC131153835 n=1 Tax=Malania oleifera TaxID=397392 RepID=UPI0025AE7FF1|nr:uncharacterized protein LOC131153835 [Malania oleifera]